MKEILLKLELSLLSEEVRTSFQKLDFLLHNDFLEYGTSGNIYTKKDILERLPKSVFAKYTLSDFKIKYLSGDVYQTRFKTLRVNQDGSETASLRSSIWKNQDNNWQMLFHQGTRQ